jgi:site-specific DNA recombinase
VDRQKRLALQDCEKLGLTVQKQFIFVDPGVSAWKRNRKRKGWEALLEAARRGEIKHIVCYHPDRLMRQPHDLEELLSISDQYGIMLYGRINKRDLQDPDDRYALRIEVAHACRSSDDTSRRLKDFKAERAEQGLPNGARAFGYTKNGMRINEKEAAVVREIFERFTNGETPFSIATDLNRRGIKTAKGKAWGDKTIRRQLCCHHVAGISVHHGKEIGKGQWPTIIDRRMWDFTQDLLSYRATTQNNDKPTKPKRTYLLRGLMTCGKCGSSMSGSSGSTYRCARAIRQDEQRCALTIRADLVEEFVTDAALRLLAELSISAQPKRPTARIEQAMREIEDDERQLRELNEMWKAKEVTTAEYREMRRDIQSRIRSNERKATPSGRPIEAIKDLIGPNAKKKWRKLSDQRKNSVLRFLFNAVIIAPHDKKAHPNSFDYGRIDIEPADIIA